MKFKFDDSQENFGIFFTREEYQLAYGLLQHINAADKKSLEIILNTMDQLYELSENKPILRIVGGNDENLH